MSHQHCNFFLSSRDIRFLKKITRKRPMGQTRWPSIFSSLDVIGSHKSKPNLNILFKLRILVFQCPGRTHITNFTRMPHLLFKSPSDQTVLQSSLQAGCSVFTVVQLLENSPEVLLNIQPQAFLRCAYNVPHTALIRSRLHAVMRV